MQEDDLTQKPIDQIPKSQAPDAQPQNAQPQPVQPQPAQPQYGQPQYVQPQPAQPQYVQPQYGQPQYGQPQYAQPQYAQPQYGQPQYGQPQYGQPQYGQPQYGQAQYAQAQYAYGAGIGDPGSSGAPVATKILITVAMTLELLKAVRSLYNLFSGGVFDADSIFGLIKTGAFVVSACVLMIVGVYLRNKPAVYGTGLILFGVGAIAAEIYDFVTYSYGYINNVELLLRFILVWLLTGVFLIIAGLHYILKGRGINGKVKTVFAILYAALNFTDFIYMTIRYELNYFRYFAGYTWFLYVTNLLVPVLLGIGTALYTVRRNKPDGIPGAY